MQRSVLSDFPDADISVSLVWIQMPGFNDSMKTASKIAATFDDPRIRHFYDPLPNHRAGKAFAEGLIPPGHGPAWDIYFFYENGAIWTDGPPRPVEWMHQLGGGRRADPERFRSGEQLVRGLHQAMHATTKADCTRDHN